MSFKINQWESNITGPSRIVFCKTRDIMTKLLMMQKSRRMRSPLRSIEVKLLSANPQGSVTQNLTCHAHAPGGVLLTHQNFRAQVKADIEADMMKGILERVPAGEHDTW